MRYSIQKATVQQVKASGGIDIKEAPKIGAIFATLPNEGVVRLKALGCLVTQIGKVKTDIIPSPRVPTPVAAEPIYSPEELVVGIGFDKIRDSATPPLYGEGYNLAIVDTGIRETWEKIAGRVVYRKNLTSDLMEDGFNHGTAVCSIALAVSPLCNILNYKVLDSKGEGTEEEVVLALDDILLLHEAGSDYAPRVVNLSLGSPDDGNPDNILRVACRVLVDRNIWVVASAGNSGPSPFSITSPATEKYVFCIGSMSYEPFIISDFSSRGPTLEGLIKPDAVFLGENIKAGSSVSNTATIAKSGTSFGTPFAAGSIILFINAVETHGLAALQSGRLPSEAIYHQILELATPKKMMDDLLKAVCIKPEGAPLDKDNDYGFGVPYGPLMLEVFAPPVVMGIETMMPLITGIFTMSILGMVIRGISK